MGVKRSDTRASRLGAERKGKRKVARKVVEAPRTGPTEQPPRERTVLATIQAIERYGVSGATVRRIAEAAGVNVAAINYYFGSKERLLETALGQTLHEAFPKALGELREHIAQQGGHVEAGVRVFLQDYIRHAFQYPRISVAHLRDALLEQDYSGHAVAAVRTFLDGFYGVVAPAMPHRTHAEKRLAVVHVWATLFELAMLPELFGVSGESLSGEEMVALLLRTLFPA